MEETGWELKSSHIIVSKDLEAKVHGAVKAARATTTKEQRDWIIEDWNNWYKLDRADQLLWTEFTNGDIEREITRLQMNQQPIFPGATEIIATSMSDLAGNQ